MPKLLIFIVILLTLTAKTFASEKQLIGHFFAWNGELNHVNTNGLSHLIYNHFNLTAESEITKFNDQRSKAHFLHLKKIKEQQPHLKVLASIGGWALSKHYPKVVADLSKSNKLIKNIGKFIAQTDFDGVSIDWRYPGVSRESTVGDRDMDGEYLLRLIKNIKQAYPDMPLIITVSVLTDDLAYLPLAKLSQHVDFIEVLSLDLAGHWQNHTGHASPLYSSPQNPSIFTGSVNESITYLLNTNVPAQKLVISVPAFGHGWMGVNNHKQGLFQPSESIPPADYSTPEQVSTGLYRQHSIDKLFFSHGYQSYWDNLAKASYLFNSENGHFISFESSRSLKAKINYIHEKKLAGISIQNLDADTSLVAQAATLLRQETRQSIEPNVTSEAEHTHINLLVFTGLSLIIMLRVVAYHRIKQQKKAALAEELFSVKQQLQQLTLITDNERTVLQQQLIKKQQQYKVKVGDEAIAVQLQQMMEYLSEQIQQLSNNPNLLSELHKVSSNKNKLLYIQAEKGYTGLYLQNAHQPEYIYSRLKQLKQYYSDDFLIQIHRSYLVNKQKIDRIIEHADGKFIVCIGEERLPVGGSYLASLRKKISEKFV